MKFLFHWSLSLFLFLVCTVLVPSAQAQIVVAAFTGSGTAGYTDAAGGAASFYSPVSMATDADGNVYVADANNHKIRKITPAGVVTTIAGSTAGNVDAAGVAARFNLPIGIAVDALGTLYVADYLNHSIRKITPSGDVTTFAGTGNAGSADATGTAASFNNPRCLAIDGAGNLYVADFSNNKIRKITPAGEVSTLAGSGTAGSADATGSAASFNGPFGIDVDDAGNVFVGDYFNHKIRKVSPAGEVTTIAGSGTSGNVDANGISARFKHPMGVLVDEDDNVYVADGSNNKIRKISSSGDVTTFAGSGAIGSINGIVGTARFSYPTCLAFDPYGNMYVADVGNHNIRKITFTPEIQLYQSANELISGSGNYDFGTYDQLAISDTVAFTIKNLAAGLNTLVLGPSPFITITGVNPADFTVYESDLDEGVEPGDTTFFEVRFSPTGAGVRSAIITVKNNDYDESSYSFSVTGTGTTVVATGTRRGTVLDLSVYPNPTSGTVEINVPKEVQLEVYNAQGIKVLEQTVSEGKSTFSLEQFEQGLYLIFCSDGNATSETYRIIKK